MPAAFAHDFTALRARELLGRDAPLWLTQEEESYLLGAQGPDVFFFYGMLPPWRSHKLNRYAFALHRQSGAAWARTLLKAHTGPAGRAWTLGYLCHWAADAACHPYVLSREDELPEAHHLIEQSADLLMYRQSGGKGVPRRMHSIAAITPKKRREIAQLWSESLPGALPCARIGVHEGLNAIADAQRLNAFLYSPTGGKRRLFQAAEALLLRPHLLSSHIIPLEPDIVDPLNLLRRPSGENRTNTYVEMLEGASRITARWQRAVLNCWNGMLSPDEAVDKMGEWRLEDGLGDARGHILTT